MYKLSLIVPVYNVENYIFRCLKSIYEQNIDQSMFEVLIIDDESHDRSIELVSEYANGLNNIHIIHQKNKGLGGARNTGLVHSQGEYIWFIDSDDEVINTSLNNILSYIIKSNDDIYIFDYNMKKKSDIKCINSYHKRLYSIKGCDMVNNYLVSIQVWRNLYKRSFLIKNNLFFKEHFLHEDGEFSMRVMSLANKVTYINEPIYIYYTDNSNSIMNSIRLKNLEDLLLYFDSLNSFSCDHKLNDVQKRCTNIYINSAIGLLFKNAIYISKGEFSSFKILLSQYKSLIIQAYWNKNVKEKIILKMLLIIRYQHFYNLVYNKKIRIRK
jgi:glycosyltransferase involved in cell wall biosynthesis